MRWLNHLLGVLGQVSVVGIFHLPFRELLGSDALLLGEVLSLLLLGALPFWEALLQLDVVVRVVFVERA